MRFVKKKKVCYWKGEEFTNACRIGWSIRQIRSNKPTHKNDSFEKRFNGPRSRWFLRSREKAQAKIWIILAIFLRFLTEAVKTGIFESVRTVFAQNGCAEFLPDDLLACAHRWEQNEQVRIRVSFTSGWRWGWCGCTHIHTYTYLSTERSLIGSRNLIFIKWLYSE